MTSLSWLRNKAPDSARAAPVWPELAELELYLGERRVIGWIAPEGERTSDWLNRGQEVELIGAVEVGLIDPPPSLAEPDARAVRLRVAVPDILFAVPPSLPAGRQLRLHRRISRIHFEVEGYQLSGRVHTRPGADAGEYLLRASQVFVPVTEAEIAHQVDPLFSRAFPVLIVNTRHVSRVHLLEPPRAAPAAESSAEPPVVPQPLPPQALEPSERPEPPEPPLPAAQLPAAGSAGSSFLDEIEPMAGAVHRALSELVALRRDGLVSEAEFAAKRAEIISRL